MRLVSVGLAMIFIGAAQAVAQQPDLGVWFGIRSANETSRYERFEIQAKAAGAEIISAPYGKTPRSWGSVVLRQDGSIEFHWAGDPRLLCALRRINQRNYKGTCRSYGQIERRLILTRWSEPSDGWELPVSDTDLRILAKARQLLSGPSVWNRHDDRACEDDAKQNSWSLFCALYQASVDEAGLYLHVRPVMTEARAALAKVTNGQRLQHPIMDYNNLESTTYADIAMIFDRAEKQLQARKASKLPDRYGNISWKIEMARLDDFATAIQNDPHMIGYIVVFGDKNGCTLNAQRRAIRAKNYLVQRRGIDPNRVIWRDLGYLDEQLVCLEGQLRGEKPYPFSHPTPVAASDVKLKRCAVQSNRLSRRTRNRGRA